MNRRESIETGLRFAQDEKMKRELSLFSRNSLYEVAQVAATIVKVAGFRNSDMYPEVYDDVFIRIGGEANDNEVRQVGQFLLALQFAGYRIVPPQEAGEA